MYDYATVNEADENTQTVPGGRIVTGTGAAAERKMPREKNERQTRREMEKLDR